MNTSRKEHYVRETTANDRTVWKSVPDSKVAFYASAGDGITGSSELHTAAAEAFWLEGDDRVWVLDDQGATCDVVTTTSPRRTRLAAAKAASERAGRVGAYTVDTPDGVRTLAQRLTEHAATLPAPFRDSLLDSVKRIETVADEMEVPNA